MTVPEYPRVSVEQYFAIEYSDPEVRYEYHDGGLRMLSWGTLQHSAIIVNLTSILYESLRNVPCRLYSLNLRVQLSPSRYVYPDLTVGCDQRDQGNEESLHYPCVVVEVLSQNTEVVDRIKKFAYYRECPSVQEIVMIDSRKVLVEVYRREQEGWLLQTLGVEDTLLLKSLGVQVAIRDIYEEIDFSVSHDSRS